MDLLWREKATPDMNNQYASYSHIMAWDASNKHQKHPFFSEGCKRRDCVPAQKNNLDQSIEIDGIACLVPYMDPPLKENLGLRRIHCV